MGSNSKKRTTMAKLSRENALRQRRLDKRAKKEARRQGGPDLPDDASSATPETGPDTEAPAPDADAQAPAEA
jgi:hypothetical protein